MTPLRTTLVEDSDDDLQLILWALKEGGFDFIHICVETEEGFKNALHKESWQLVISDHAMPRFSAPEALTVLNQSGSDMPFIIVSGTIDEEVAVKAMKAGAHDYIMKDRAWPRQWSASCAKPRYAKRNRYNREQLAYMTLHDVLARIGGDEFAAVLPQTKEEVISELVERIHQAVDQYNRENKQLPLILSVGFAVSKDENEDPVDTLKKADQLLRLGKQNRDGSYSQGVSILLAALAERDYISGGHAERMQEL